MRKIIGLQFLDGEHQSSVFTGVVCQAHQPPPKVSTLVIMNRIVLYHIQGYQVPL
jgi:hypothetical protein